MNIDIKANTERQVPVFNIPLNTSSTASEYEFIKYVKPPGHCEAKNRRETVPWDHAKF